MHKAKTLSNDDLKDPLMCRTNDEDVQDICGDLMEVFTAEAIQLLEKEEKKETVLIYGLLNFPIQFLTSSISLFCLL